MPSDGGAGWVGTSCRYAPAEVKGSEGVPGKLVDVMAMSVSGDELLCIEY